MQIPAVCTSGKSPTLLVVDVLSSTFTSVVPCAPCKFHRGKRSLSKVNFLNHKYPKHAMLVTRGTQGDVQPFVALARGLAEINGWLVTIVTENRFRDFVEENSDVRQLFFNF